MSLLLLFPPATPPAPSAVAGTWPATHWPRTWSVPVAAAPVVPVSESLLTKPPGAARYFLFDLTDVPEVEAGGTLTSPAVAEVEGDGSLTIGATAVTAAIVDGVATGKGVTVRLEDGTSGETYLLELLVTCTVSGVPSTLAARGYLFVP